MTHDELLAKISIPIILKAGIQDTDIVNLNLLVRERQALRAVVELHKPMFWKNLGNDTDGYKCQVCEGNSYPCPTIQAIEKDIG
jgi:hypothetical protein